MLFCPVPLCPSRQPVWCPCRLTLSHHHLLLLLSLCVWSLTDALHFVMTSEPARVSQLFPQLLSYCSSNSQIEKFLAALPSSQGDELLELLDMQPPSSVVAECELRLMRARDLELQIIQLVAR